MQRLTVTHVRRWQQDRGYSGLGHVYQGRYKSFPGEKHEHIWVVAWYVERNALRANLVLQAEDWRWSSPMSPPSVGAEMRCIAGSRGSRLALAPSYNEAAPDGG
jgi:hypothetical protein